MSALAPAASPRLGLRGHEWEAVLGVLLALGALVAVGPRPAMLGLLLLAAITPRLTAIDIAEHRLPDRLVLPALPVALAAALAGSVAGGTPILVAVSAGSAYAALLMVLHLVGGMGLGDVKLAPVLGLTAAAVSPAAAVAAPLLAFLAGGGVAVVTLVRSGPGTRIPFGPAMLLGAWTAVLLA
ncbi:prepilin peptidase [Amnibacterium sp.]|uniref:prepilin peptidase n=1 Tax=Amnibacterium sp. TaxID=1872496 RepID=UPI002632A9D4|nr:prepilin peptidase [Amnibacterium sp.]MCU1472583.1 prepilin peptidase [Amnibacterium sp.]